MLDVTQLPATPPFDVITVFDAIHDQVAPDVVLRRIHDALRPDGVFVMVDFKFSSHLERNLANPFAPLHYAISVMHCMTVSLAEGGAGLGTVWGQELARKMLTEAGFGYYRGHRFASATELHLHQPTCQRRVNGPDRSVGPPHTQSDGYSPTTHLTPDAAREYHAVQITTFAETEADMITVMTMTYADEAVGVAPAARELAMPAAISFTVETDGRLPSGQPLGEAIEQVDAQTNRSPAYYMVNCAHPTHFEDVLDGPWCERIVALRANASRRSHAELDDADELDEGHPEDLASRYAALRERLPQLRVLGGCCGTDHRHVAAISRAWT